MPIIKSSAELRNSYSEVSSQCHIYADRTVPFDEVMDEIKSKSRKHQDR